MNYHFQKCKHLHIGNHDINFEYTIQTNSGEMKVQKVTSEKDLEVTFDKNLKFTDHLNNKVNKANRNVGLIFRTFTFMDKDMFLKWRVSMIRKYHNHKLQTTPWHCEEEPLNHHETPGGQIKQSNQLHLSIYLSSYTQAIIYDHFLR